MKKFILLVCAIGSMGTFFLTSGAQAAGGFSTYNWIDYKVNSDGSSTYKVGSTTVNVGAQATNNVIKLLENKSMTADQLASSVSEIAKMGEDILAGKVAAPSIWSGDSGHKFVSSSIVGNTVSAACENGSTYSVTVTPSTDTSVKKDPPPPPPTCKHTTYTAGPWGACSITSNWSSDGKATCIQTRSVNPHIVTESACVSDYADSMPSNSRTNTLSIGLSNPTNTCGNAYANKTDTCTISFSINGPSEGVAGVSGLAFKDISFSAPTSVNQIDGSGPDGLIIAPSGIIEGNKISLTLASIVPFIKTGKFSMNVHWISDFTSVTSGNTSVAFKKPYVGLLQIKDGTATGTLKTGTEQTLELMPMKKTTLSSSSYALSQFGETLAPNDGINFFLQNLNGQTNGDKPSLNFTLNYKGATKLGKTYLQCSPQIRYSLDGQEIAYILSKSDAPDATYTDTEESEFIGLRVIGQIQGQGKQVITGQAHNFSDVSLSEIRSSIKKNALEAIRGMKSGNTVNNVKYVEWDITLPESGANYELLVVRNGNITIAGNLNATWKRFGIVAIRDDQSNNNLGNVYVKNSVSSIQAYIYADGGFISVDNSGVPYATNTANRTSELSNQLILKGLLLTRNTIGGAIGDKDTYILPGGIKTKDLDEAIMYDLNYVRRGFSGWDLNNNAILDPGEYKDAFVVIYDEAIRNDPPRIFLVK